MVDKVRPTNNSARRPEGAISEKARRGAGAHEMSLLVKSEASMTLESSEKLYDPKTE